MHEGVCLCRFREALEMPVMQTVAATVVGLLALSTQEVDARFNPFAGSGFGGGGQGTSAGSGATSGGSGSGSSSGESSSGVSPLLRTHGP